MLPAGKLLRGSLLKAVRVKSLHSGVLHDAAFTCVIELVTMCPRLQGGGCGAGNVHARSWLLLGSGKALAARHHQPLRQDGCRAWSDG